VRSLLWALLRRLSVLGVVLPQHTVWTDSTDKGTDQYGRQGGGQRLPCFLALKSCTDGLI
jgi:hypothetical protein